MSQLEAAVNIYSVFVMMAEFSWCSWFALLSDQIMETMLERGRFGTAI